MAILHRGTARGAQAVLAGRARAVHRAVHTLLVVAWPTMLLFAVQRLLFLVAARARPGDRLVDGGLLRWDAGWYLQIAARGYDDFPTLGPDGHLVRSNLAFFPFLPKTAAALEALTGADLRWILLVLAWLGAMFGALGVFALGNALHGRWVGMALTLAWGAMPQAVVLVMGYPEGWLAGAVAFALLALITRRPLLAGVLGAWAGTIKPDSLPLVAVVGVWLVWLIVARIRGSHALPWWRLLAALVVTPAGLAAVMVFVAVATGRLFGYAAVQDQWGTHTASPLGLFGRIHEVAFDPAQSVPAQATYIGVILSAMVLVGLLVGMVGPDNWTRYLPLAAYTSLATLLVFSHHEYFWSLPRHLMPHVPLLLPLVTIRQNRVVAGLLLVFVTLVSAEWGASFLAMSRYSI